MIKSRKVHKSKMPGTVLMFIFMIIFFCPQWAVSKTGNGYAGSRLGTMLDAEYKLVKAPAGSAKGSSWKARLEAGLNGTDGNSESFTSRLAVNTLRKTPKLHTRAEMAYYYGRIEDEDAVNNLMAMVINDWLLPDSPWSAFVKGRYDYDEFNFWKHRLSLHGGVAYRIVDQASLSFLFRGGAGLTKEYESEDEDLKPEALFGWDLWWLITDRQELKLEQTVYPNLGDMGEYRLDTSGSWTAGLGSDSNMSMGAGFTHEYQSEVDPGYEHYDLKYYAMITIDF